MHGERGAPRPEERSERSFVDRLRDIIDDVQADGSSADKSPKVLVDAHSKEALRIAVLVVGPNAATRFDSEAAQATWERALEDVSRADRDIVRALQSHLAPASAAIFLTRLVASICRVENIPMRALQRLASHFLAREGAPERLPVEDALRLAASLGSWREDGDEAEGERGAR